jgi:hypothetical protein
MLRTSRVNEIGGLSTLDLEESILDEGILDVDLVSLPVEGECEKENDSHHRWFDNQAERLVEVNTLLLKEASEYPTCFLAVKRAIELEFVANDPLVGHDIGVSRGSII